MGYALVSKVLSTYTPMEELALALALAQPQAQLVIYRGQPLLGLHRRHQYRHRHHVKHERLVVLDMPLVTQNRVALR